LATIPVLVYGLLSANEGKYVKKKSGEKNFFFGASRGFDELMIDIDILF
jgi:hypothetical protein